MSDALPADAPSAADVAAAAQRLAGRVKRTPLHCSQQVDERVGARVLFKCENLQRVGAFKFRGATNALLRLSPEQRARGVVSWSSGNHAQALARASREQGVAATIVMPQDASGVQADA